MTVCENDDHDGWVYGGLCTRCGAVVDAKFLGVLDADSPAVITGQVPVSGNDPEPAEPDEPDSE